MLNLLIANKNLQNLQDLLNYISLYVPDIRISYLARNGREALHALIDHNYDIVLLENELEFYDGLDILERLPYEKTQEYKKSIIFLSTDMTLNKNVKSHNMVFETFPSTESISTIIMCLKKIVTLKQSNDDVTYMKTKIINELQTIGYNLAHIGTHYIAESVLLIATLHYNSENLSKYIYPKVSEIYNRSLYSVKANVTSATDAAYKNMDKATLRKHLKIPEDVKPTTKMVINMVLKKLNYII